MKCSKCEFENREGAKFCKECGNRLELACPGCGHLYTPGEKFCDECGHDLRKPTEGPFLPTHSTLTGPFIGGQLPQYSRSRNFLPGPF